MALPPPAPVEIVQLKGEERVSLTGNPGWMSFVPHGSILYGVRYRAAAVPIQRLVQEASFGPAEISRLVLAYEGALELLRPKDQSDAVKEIVAKKIVEIARSGERDAAKICARALIELGLPVRD